VHDSDRDGGASGFVCPRCGGALWERRDSESASFECRIGDTFTATRLWIEHCAATNHALLTAGRALTENAALARKLARWTDAQGNVEAAVRLAQEAEFEDRAYVQVRELLDGLDDAKHEPAN
jgi:two-component system chemotaxis response regulator CheB